MKYDWMIDVLADLETFSAANDMPKLASELAEIKLIAAVEIATKEAHEAQANGPDSVRRRPH